MVNQPGYMAKPVKFIVKLPDNMTKPVKQLDDITKQLEYWYMVNQLDYIIKPFEYLINYFDYITKPIEYLVNKPDYMTEPVDIW